MYPLRKMRRLWIYPAPCGWGECAPMSVCLHVGPFASPKNSTPQVGIFLKLSLFNVIVHFLSPSAYSFPVSSLLLFLPRLHKVHHLRWCPPLNDLYCVYVELRASLCPPAGGFPRCIHLLSQWLHARQLVFTQPMYHFRASWVKHTQKLEFQLFLLLRDKAFPACQFQLERWI